MSILQGTIPSDWTGDYCRYAVCWPNSPQWEAVLRGVLVLPSRGRFWDEHTGNIIEAQDIIRQTYEQNLHLKGIIMACDDPGLAEIATALQLIAAAMAAQGKSCCDGGGSAGAPANEPPFDPFEEVDPGIEPPPDGFDSWEQFYEQKCAIAWDIIHKLESDLGTLAVIEWGSAGAEAITASLLIILVTPLPAAAVIALVFFLLTVAAVVIVATALTIILDNEEDLVCELYNGISSESSRSNFMSKFNDLVASGVSDPVEQYAVSALTSYMVSSTVTNRLYIRHPTIMYPPEDCQGCFPGCADCIRRYDKDQNPMQYYEVPRDWAELDDQGGQGLFTVYFGVTGPDFYKMQFRNLVGQTHWATPDFICQQDAGNIFYEGDDFALFAAACEDHCLSTGTTVQWFIRSSTQFTVEAKIEFCF